MRNKIFVVLILCSIHDLYGQDSSTTSLPKGIMTSVVIGGGIKTFTLHAYSFELFRYRSRRKLISCETGINFSQTNLPNVNDSIQIKNGLEATSLNAELWFNKRFMLGQNERSIAKVFLGWSAGGFGRYSSVSSSTGNWHNSSYTELGVAGRFLVGSFIKISNNLLWNVELNIPLGIAYGRDQIDATSIPMRQSRNGGISAGILVPGFKTGFVLVIP